MTGTTAGGLAAVRDVLRGPVCDILQSQMPALAHLPREGVFAHVLNRPRLLDQALALARERPQLFATFLGNGASPDTPLACGHSLNQVIALILRAAAKRYFLRLYLRRLYRGVLGRARRLLHRLTGIGAAARRKARELAIHHFEALAPYLAHDWQARLIPVYAAIPPATLTQLGPSLLHQRQAAALRRLAGVSRVAALPSRRTKLEPGARRVSFVPARSRHRLSPSDLTAVAASVARRPSLADIDASALIKLVGRVPDPVLLALSKEGLEPRQAAAFLIVAAHVLGETTFLPMVEGANGTAKTVALLRSLGHCGDEDLLAALVEGGAGGAGAT